MSGCFYEILYTTGMIKGSFIKIFTFIFEKNTHTYSRKKVE